jgi:hypothetical protein
VPVLLVHGDAGPRPLAAVEALARALPRAELVVLRGVGYFPLLEAPEALRRVARGFLASLPQVGPHLAPSTACPRSAREEGGVAHPMSAVSGR